MAAKKPTTATHEANITLDKTLHFWSKYNKLIIYIGVAVIAALAAFFAYNKFVKEPKEEKAAEMIFPAQSLFDKMANSDFSKDSVNILLNGGTLPDGTAVTGLLKIMNNYSGTESANLAAYMTGASYLQIKEFDKAIKYLKEFSSHGARQVESKANLMLGHAYAEKKNVNEALSYYKKAASVNDKDETMAPTALMIAANYAESQNNSAEAISLFKQVKDKYPTYPSVASGEIDKHLAKLGVLE